MFWYIVICILMIYPLSIVYAGNISGKNANRFALMTACFILWFFMAMRAVSVGVDTQYYSYVFTQFADIPLEKVFTAVTFANEKETWSFNFEPGYRLINKLLSYVSDSPQAITVFNSSLIILLLNRVIRRDSPDYLLSIWLYITLGIYQTEMNVTRNAIAILIVYNSFHYAQKKKFGKYLACCLLAATFHAAVLIFIPVYWLLDHITLNPGKIVVSIVLFTAVGFMFPVVGSQIAFMLPDSLGKYLISSNEKMQSLMVGIFYAGICMISCSFLKKEEKKKIFEKHQLGMLMFTLNLCFFGLNTGLEYAARMAALFGPYLIIFIPQVLELIESPVRKQTAAFSIAAICTCQYILRLCINNIGGTMPYQFFW